ncbi:MAG TPA: SRPBCC family protein [Pseudonocardiaceae bacterium]
MARGQSVRQVDKPVSTVWRVVADHRNVATWGPGMSVDMERDGEPDPAGVGAIRVINWPGLRGIREEITAFEPNRRMAYRALSGIPVPDWAGEIELAERPGRTTIRWSLSATTRLPGAGLILDLAAGFLLSALVKAIGRAQ